VNEGLRKDGQLFECTEASIGIFGLSMGLRNESISISHAACWGA